MVAESLAAPAASIMPRVSLIARDRALAPPSESPTPVLATATPTPEPTAPPPTVAPPRPAATPVPRPVQPASTAAAVTLSGGFWAFASWYGPGFYGNRTACGQTFTPSSWGVAHKTLRCGAMVQITYRGQTVSAPVIDRGPYVAGREVDLAAAVANALGFSGVQQVYLVIP